MDLFKLFYPKYSFKREEEDRHRFYYGVVDGYVKVVAGITTILGAVCHSKYKEAWLVKHGYEALAEAAKYGSLVHHCIYLYNLNNPDRDWLDKIKNHRRRRDVSRELVAWSEMRRMFDMQAILLEVPLYGVTGDGDKFQKVEFCCTLDFAAIMEYEDETVEYIPTGELYKVGEKKGQIKTDKNGLPLTEKVIKTVKKSCVAIIDAKSNPFDKATKDGKEYFDEHLYQLKAQETAFRQNYGHLMGKTLPSEIKIFNWSSTNYRENKGANTFVLTEWVNTKDFKPNTQWATNLYTDIDIENMNHLLSFAKNKGFNIPSGRMKVTLPFHLGDTHNPIQTYSYEEWAKMKIAEEEQKQSEERIKRKLKKNESKTILRPIQTQR